MLILMHQFLKALKYNNEEESEVVVTTRHRGQGKHEIKDNKRMMTNLRIDLSREMMIKEIDPDHEMMTRKIQGIDQGLGMMIQSFMIQ